MRQVLHDLFNVPHCTRLYPSGINQNENRMPTLDLKYQPLRTTLYSTGELYEGFSLLDGQSMTKTADFAIYSDWVRGGRANQREYLHSMMQSLHDHTITGERDHVLAGKSCAAVMGGHRLARNDPRYHEVAEIARQLTNKGFLVATGGGPGAMEAAHLGAAMADRDPKDLERAIQELSASPTFPHFDGDFIDAAGVVNLDIAQGLFEWFAPAYEVWSVYRSVMSPSLAIPTWYYGHEPTTVFATDIAKYFQNSIREDGLLAIASAGILFAPGAAGTVQEIFQDAAQNYYKTFGKYSPMVLFGRDYWEPTGVPAVLKWLSHDGKRFEWWLVDSVEEAISAFGSA